MSDLLWQHISHTHISHKLRSCVLLETHPFSTFLPSESSAADEGGPKRKLSTLIANTIFLFRQEKIP